MVSMLGDVVDRGTGSAARAQGVRFAVGGKTGTTNEFKDAWFVGFSSAVVVGVWVGFDQPKPIGREAHGSRYALRSGATSCAAPPGCACLRVRGAGWSPRGAALPHLVSQAGRGLPGLQRVLQGRGRGPDAPLSAAPGDGEAAGSARSPVSFQGSASVFFAGFSGSSCTELMRARPGRSSTAATRSSPRLLRAGWGPFTGPSHAARRRSRDQDHPRRLRCVGRPGALHARERPAPGCAIPTSSRSWTSTSSRTAILSW